MFKFNLSQTMKCKKKDFGFQNQGNFLLVESGVQGNFVCGIRKTVQGVRNPSNDWNPECKFRYQRLEYSTWNLRRGIQNTRMSLIPLGGARRFIDKVRRKRRLKLGGLGRGHLCYREARSVLSIINLATIVLIAFLIVVIKFITIQFLNSPLWTSSLV